MDTLTQLRAGKLAGATRLDLACGLTEFPREIFDLADTLEILNLSGNRLSTLPEDFGRLTKLRILFCSENEFAHVPASVGECPALNMVGFKANKIQSVDAAAFPQKLRWLILTDNQIAELPSSLGNCSDLQKLMLSGNRLPSLPEHLAACQALEMVRISANLLPELPDWLLQMPRMTWLAYAGNPCTPLRSPAKLPPIVWSDLQLQHKIGGGASGDIFKAAHDQLGDMAVKVFKGEMTSDGLPEWEMSACIQAGAHPHLIPILGEVVNHPQNAKGLAMKLIDPAYRTLAGPPDFESCTRDVYDKRTVLAPEVALRIAQGVTSAAEHLHRQGVMHGDFYAHNVLWRPDGHCYLGDFGGASPVPDKCSRQLQRVETRAVGVLLEELAGVSNNASLQEIASSCMAEEPAARPTLADVISALSPR